MKAKFPTGIVTLVFTDLEGSSDLSERHGAAFEATRMEHFHVLREAAERWHGYEVETAGDALFVVFSSAADAVQFAVDAQRSMAHHDWPPEIGEIRVRIGMHTGEPFIGMDMGRPTYRGPSTNRAARVQAAGHGGQVLVSNATYDMAVRDLPAEISFHDCGIHRLKGVGEERLWQLCHFDLHREFPPLNTLNPERHNLPAPSGALIGREEEIVSWRELLQQPTTRLLTLVGPGGMGKTRSALQLAEVCVQDFDDGVWWVEMEGVRTGDAMPAQIAAAVRLYLQPQPSVKEQLFQFLHTQQMLLVLDNIEQIPDAAGVISDLLKTAPRLKCVVTSRCSLELRAELLQEVPPLPSPDAQRLFVDRAHARKADFAVTEENGGDIAELCRRLEGVPLAIELAASRITGLAPREILSNLDQRFRILQTRSPDLPLRQRALRAAIDWSYELLSDDDKSLLAQLAVFVHGFSYDDAEAVCDAPDTFEGVLELRRQSLLRDEIEATTQQTRFFMLESVRDYATEKLQGTEQAAIVQQNHTEYFLRFAEERFSNLRTPQEGRAFQQLEINLDNVRAAMDRAQQNDEYMTCAKLALALATFFRRRGFHKEAVRRLQIGLDAIGQVTVEHTRLLAELLRERAGLDQDQSEWEHSRRCADEALSLFQQLNEHKGQAEAYNLLGLIAKHEKQSDAARRYFGLALEHFGQVDDEVGVAIVQHNLGLVEFEDGGMDAATQHMEESLRLRRKHGDRRGMAESLNNLGVLAQERSAFEEAWQYYEEALQFERDLGHTVGVARLLYNLAEIAEERNDLQRAYRLATVADALFDEVGSLLKRHSTEICCRLAKNLDYSAQQTALLRQSLKDKSLNDLVAWALAHETSA